MRNCFVVAAAVLSFGCSASSPKQAPPVLPAVSAEEPTDSTEANVRRLQRLWPEAMKTVQVSLPKVDLSAWRALDAPHEAALLLPQFGSCSQLLLGSPDTYGVSSWLVTAIDDLDGKRSRSSAECELAPDLVIRYGNIRIDEEVDGAWQRVEGMATPAPERNVGLLTRVTASRLEYGGERLDPTGRFARLRRLSAAALAGMPFLRQNGTIFPASPRCSGANTITNLPRRVPSASS